MERRDGRRRLIVNADDFGRSESINAAVIEAHRHGILTSASLMVNEASFTDAVRLARANPTLAVGLHLTLACGHSALSPARIPGLVGKDGRFENSPVTAGARYFLRRSLRSQLRDELAAQFERFRSTGLPMDHVNGHLHLHLHPAIFPILMENAGDWGITHFRLTSDDFRLNARLARGRWSYRVAHFVIYRWLSSRARPVLRQKGIRHTGAVFGLLQDSNVDERFVLGLLNELPPGDSELYSHPSGDQFHHELKALLSPRVQDQVRRLNIELIRYRDL
ncbi:MAG: hypothetical protein QOF48_1482 [Verrucomicrobiota bacterium]|jgi:hopanoid biosynthesis associated protein HpnK